MLNAPAGISAIGLPNVSEIWAGSGSGMDNLAAVGAAVGGKVGVGVWLGEGVEVGAIVAVLVGKGDAVIVGTWVGMDVGSAPQAQRINPSVQQKRKINN